MTSLDFIRLHEKKLKESGSLTSPSSLTKKRPVRVIAGDEC